MVSIDLSPKTVLTLLIAVLHAAQLMTHAFPVVSARRAAFDGDFFRQRGVKDLVEEHKKAFKQDKLPVGCYPDMGNGRFSAHLSYKQWFRFNSAQRAHHNSLELAPSFFAAMIVGSLIAPLFAATTGIVYIIGREFYVHAYAGMGPNARLLGSSTSQISIIVLVLGVIYHAATYPGVIDAALSIPTEIQSSITSLIQ